jgi:hypothetical protein
MSRMTYMRSWKSLRLTSHTWLSLNPQIGRPLSRIVVPLVCLLKETTRYFMKTKVYVVCLVMSLVFKTVFGIFLALQSNFTSATVRNTSGSIIINQASIFLSLASGVVQRSVFGPFLFSLFINDITFIVAGCLPSEYVDCVERMNADLERTHQWSLRNGLLVNPIKSQAYRLMTHNTYI